MIRQIFSIIYKAAKRSRDKKFAMHLFGVWIFCQPVFGLVIALLRHYYRSASFALIVFLFLLIGAIMYFVIGKYLKSSVVQQIRDEAVKDQSTKRYVIAQLLVILLSIVSSLLFLGLMIL
ncbi:MAG: hypothetical protein V4590_14115 [Bacteroidota bacterium]